MHQDTDASGPGLLLTPKFMKLAHQCLNRYHLINELQTQFHTVSPQFCR